MHHSGVLFVICEASALIGELAYAKERATLTSLFSANYFIGSILASAVTTGTFALDSTWGWRIPSLLQAAFSGIQVLFLPFCPESPRWLVSHGRGDEAYSILRKYHGEGVEGEEYVRREYAQIEATLKIEKAIAKRFPWADVFRDKAMFHRFAVAGLTGIFGQVSGNGYVRRQCCLSSLPSLITKLLLSTFLSQHLPLSLPPKPNDTTTTKKQT